MLKVITHRSPFFVETCGQVGYLCISSSFRIRSLLVGLVFELPLVLKMIVDGSLFWGKLVCLLIRVIFAVLNMCMPPASSDGYGLLHALREAYSLLVIFMCVLGGLNPSHTACRIFSCYLQCFTSCPPLQIVRTPIKLCSYKAL